MIVPEGVKLGDCTPSVAVAVPPAGGSIAGLRLPVLEAAGSIACTGIPVSGLPGSGTGIGGVVVSGTTRAYAPGAGTVKLQEPLMEGKLEATRVQACKAGS